MDITANESMAGRVVLLGIASDENSSFMRGPAQAPSLIRAALQSPSSNQTSETGISLSEHPRFVDIGDLETPDRPDVYSAIEAHVGASITDGSRPLILGGDHAITYPILRAISRQHRTLSILHFDAHPDLYDTLDGNRLSHACPFARIMEEGLVKRLVQVGIRTLNAHQKHQAQQFGVEVHEMRSFNAGNFNPLFDEPVYLSFDMDALDPAHAPGISHFEPGGLSMREVITILHKIKTPVIGADIVEYNPRHDINGMTAMVAAKLVKEIAGIMLRNWA